MKRTAFLSLVLGLCVSNGAFAKDSMRLACAGVTTAGNEKVALSIDLLDYRSSGGNARDNELSAIHQGSLFQGTTRSIGQLPKGTVTLKNTVNNRVFLAAKYEVFADNAGSYTLSLNGKIATDPRRSRQGTKVPVSAQLPCVDLSL